MTVPDPDLIPFVLEAEGLRPQWSPACITERVAYQVGKKLFKSQWAAFRYMAKCELMAELQAEVLDAEGRDWLADVQDQVRVAFRQKYRYHDPDYPCSSSWYRAVNERARIIRARNVEV